MTWLPRLPSLRVGVVLLVCLAAAGSGASAQQLEPRTYSNAPVGMNFLVVGYGYATGSITSDPAVPLENADIDSHETVLGYARVLDVWGRSGKVDVVLPYAWASGSATYAGEYREREVSGPGDPRFRFSVNLCGAPALSLKEFAGYRQNFIFGASLQVIRAFASPSTFAARRPCPSRSSPDTARTLFSGPVFR